MELDANPGAPLQRVPAEILDVVISQPCLGNEDVKSLRLASKVFERLCARHLFRQISISAVRRDWEAFLSIAHSPALACFAQTLVWQELSGNFEYLRDESFERAIGPKPRRNSADDDITLSTLAAQVVPLFWLTPEHTCTTALNNGDKESVKCLPFWNDFVNAVDKLPSLRLLVSQPMHPDRLVQSPTSGYPLTARAIISFLQFPSRWEGFTGSFNLGFLFYLIPLLKLYARRGDVQRWKLSFTEETEIGGTSLEHLKPQDASAFRQLDHLQLRIFEENFSPARDISGLAAGLAPAVHLTHFHLRYTQARKFKGIAMPASAPIHRSPLYEIPTLPSLRFLCLDEVVLENGFIDTPENSRTCCLDHKQPAFVDIVKRHAATLKSLYGFASAATEHKISRSFDEAIGLWVDECGVYHDPRIDQEVTPCSRACPHPGDWEVQNDRKWDNKLGLWRGILPGNNLQLHRFAIDRSASTSLENDPDQYSENIPSLYGEYYSITDENPANTEHPVCYWEVYDGQSGHPTEVWHFIHRNGEEAYGQDPLDFWSDWKGNAWGDKAIATPFGRHFELFYQGDLRLPGGGEGAKAVELPTQEEIGIKYGEPIVFEPRDEPTRIWGQG
ncbi:hypothetical protein VFPPC_03955 [Pochonia chlamydosporia 170]|uniref:F-box domain-containing protein n=1 Tax=Pochonia chlamydosporia 170 TaxID=1380566 RepID=A0A179FR14_METCM|nr:hypothetical protein VFPPC_03955 [Pochonia chlamydosporia 170]OAQ67581.2 hypothetical protein VFPPC_03955 [Pochonia chlamydosporia 170]